MPVQFLEQEILEITETTWQVMLGEDLQAGALPAIIDLDQEFWTGKVEISGTWNGVVLLHGSGSLTHAAASAIFASACHEITVQDRKDAMYELTNVIAGNIKSLLPGPCQLSLPQIMPTNRQNLEVVQAQCISKLAFEHQDQSLFVSLWKW